MTNSAPGFIKHPGYSIELAPISEQVRIIVDGVMVCQTTKALWLHENRHQPALYVPLVDADAKLLVASHTESYCPFKGQANYYGVRSSDGVRADLFWEYSQPFDEMLGILGYLGVYSDRVDSIEIGNT
jgi:uncharacterized protein (DUF427 family)